MAGSTQSSTSISQHFSAIRHAPIHLLLICVVTAATYANSLGGVFLLDDQRYIVENERIRSLADIGTVLSHRRPLLDLSLALNYAINGLRVQGYHVFNILVHILAAMVLYSVIRRAISSGRMSIRWRSRAPVIALASALIWAVHPLQTQSVTYIVQRSESMMGLAMMFILYSMLRAGTTTHSGKWGALAILGCALGMLSKPSMVVTPFITLLFDRAYVASSWREVMRRRWMLHVGLMATWSLLFMTHVAPGVLSTTNTRATVGFSVQGLRPFEYLLSQSGVILRYLGLSLWPNPQCLDYAWPIATNAGAYVPQGVAVLMLLACTVWTWFRKPAFGFVPLFFFLTLSPTSSFIPIRDLAFEQRMYLPLASVAILLVLGVDRVISYLARKNSINVSVQRNLTTLVLVVATLSLSATTWERNKKYDSALAMWTDVTQRRPHNARAFSQLSAAFRTAGSNEEALQAIRHSVTLDPDDPDTQANLGKALHEVGEIDEAMEHLRQAVRLEPSQPLANLHIGLILAQRGQLSTAVAAFRRALPYPTYRTDALFNLCAAEVQLGLIDEAVKSCEASLQLDDNRYEAHFNLGLALVRQGKHDSALRHFFTAVKLRPNLVQLRMVLAHELGEVGKTDEAENQIKEVLRLDPGNEAAQQALSNLRRP